MTQFPGWYQYETELSAQIILIEDDDVQYLSIWFRITSEDEHSDSILNYANRDIDEIKLYFSDSNLDLYEQLKVKDETMTIVITNILFDNDGWSSRKYDRLNLEFQFTIEPPDDTIEITPTYVRKKLQHFQLNLLPQLLISIQKVYPKILSYLLLKNMTSDLGSASATTLLNKFKREATNSFFDSRSTVLDKNDFGNEIWLEYRDETFGFKVDDKDTKQVDDKPINNNDPCNVLKLKTYKPKKLVDDKRPQKSAITYTFKDGFKTFTVQYFHKHKEARVRLIECDKDDGKCKEFRHDMWEDNKQMIIGHWTDRRIEIDLVYMGKAKGSGHCTKAVSYMLKVLLLESAKKKCYPYIGRVYISSTRPCSAVNCYSHAFINNGFLPNKSEVKQFLNDSMNLDPDGFGMYNTFDFVFDEFMSTTQKEKYDAKAKKAKEKINKKKNKDSIASRILQRRGRRKFKITLKF